MSDEITESVLDMIPPKKGSCYSIDVAVTLTLSPHVYTMSTISQAELVRQLLLEAVSSTSIKYSAFIEEDKKYCCHVHAIMKVRLTDYVKRYGVLRYLHNLFRGKNWGKIKDINPVTNYDSWTIYITKDVNRKRYLKYIQYELLPEDENRIYEREYYPVIKDDYELLLSD